MASMRPILLVEDNPDDERLTLRALKRSQITNPILVARNGEDALKTLEATEPLPIVVFSTRLVLAINQRIPAWSLTNMEKPIDILLIEDSDDDTFLMVRELRRYGLNFSWERVQTAEALQTMLQERAWDAIISDYNLPRLDAPAALEILQHSQLDIPFIVVSGTIGEQSAVELMKAGAHDYLMKGNLTRLPEAVRREVRDATIRATRQQALTELCQSEAKNRAILQVMPDLMFRVSADGIYREFVTNKPELDLIAGQNPVGYSVLEVLPPDIARQNLHYLEQALCTGQMQVWERQVQVRDRIIYEEVRVVKSGSDEALFIVRDISDRKQAEADLRESQRRYANLVAAVPVGIFQADAEGSCTYINERYTQITGLSLEAASGEDWQQGLHPEDRDRVANRWQDSVRDGSSGQHEYRFVRPDGTVKWLYGQTIVERDESGKTIGYIGSITDISDRKAAETIMRCQLAAIDVEIGGIAILEGGTILYLNQAHLTLFGYDCPKELVGKSWRVLYSLVEIERFEREIWPALESDRTWTGEAIATRKDGSTFAEGLSLTLTEDGLLICACDDISDRKQTERALLDSEARWQFALEGSGDGIWDWNARTNKVFFSHQWKAMLGYSDAEIGDTLDEWYDRMHPDDRDRCYTNLDKHFNGETRIYQNEYRMQCRDGSYKWILDRGKVIERTADGKPLRVIGTHTDITERKQAEAQLQRTNEELARATRLKDEFLANMSHELRTPLNAILGMAEGLQEGVFGEVNPKQIEALKAIERSGSHLLELINDILDVAKIESGQLKLELAPIAIAHLCRSSVALIEPQARKKGLQLVTKLPSNLPELAIDERRIRQVLINLLSNAVKFTPEGGCITLEVTCHVFVENKDAIGNRKPYFLQISVSDTGIGIAPEYLDKLFEPFVQIDSALNRQYMGTGLGLALVKHIVEMHGGHVGVTSKVSVGSCFTIALPCTACPSCEPDSAAPPDGNSIPELLPPKAFPLILLAEDNEANSTTVTSYLQAKGYRILLAKNGEEAIALAREKTPDLILMDIQMPGMDGLEAIQALRRDADLCKTPIIALTALAMKGDRDRCLAAGANEYLSKPVRLKQLAIAIQQRLSSPVLVNN